MEMEASYVEPVCPGAPRKPRRRTDEKEGLACAREALLALDSPPTMGSTLSALPRHSLRAVFTAYLAWMVAGRPTDSPFEQLLELSPVLDSEIFYLASSILPQAQSWDMWGHMVRHAMSESSTQEHLTTELMMAVPCRARRTLQF